VDASQSPAPLSPVPLPGSLFELRNLQRKIVEWLDAREAEGVQIDEAMGAYLVQLKEFDCEIKAGRLRELPADPLYSNPCEMARLVARWRWPSWAVFHFDADDSRAVSGCELSLAEYRKQRAELLKNGPPKTGTLAQLATINCTIAQLHRMQAMAPMERLLKRVAGRIAELERDESRIGPAGAGQMTEATATIAESQQSQDGSSGGQQPVILTSEEHEVLKFLEPQKHTHVQGQLQNALARNKLYLNDKTLSRILKRLEELGFINRPHGPKKGVAITEKGRKYLA